MYRLRISSYWSGGILSACRFNTSSTANPSPNRDPYLYGTQLIYDTKWSSKVDTSLSATWLSIQNKNNLSVAAGPDQNVGNLRTDAPGAAAGTFGGGPANGFNAAILGTSLTYKLDSFPMYDGAFPIKFSGEWMHNMAAATQNEAWNAGITLGKAGHKGLWEINYKYEFLRSDAWYEEMVDDDFGAVYSGSVAAGSPNLSRGVTGVGVAQAAFKGGTNAKGHVIKAVYNITDSLQAIGTFYVTEQITPLGGTVGPTSAGHFIFDLMWKF